MFGVSSLHIESLQLIRYKAGQFYKPHHDSRFRHQPHQYRPHRLALRANNLQWNERIACAFTMNWRCGVN